MRKPVRFLTSSASLKMSVAALALAAALAGCSGSTQAGSSSPAATGEPSSSAAPGPAVGAEAITEDTHYDGDDLIWDAESEIPVTLADGGSSAAGAGVDVDGNTVTITAAGTYRLSGSLSDGQVAVAAGEEDVVRVILDGAELASSTGSPFVVTSANEVLVYLADGSTNTLTDAKTYADTGDDAPNAALYSMEDLTIAGTGALTVNGNAFDGIVSKDGLVLAAGNVTVQSADDGIKGKDYVVLAGGRYNITAGGDGVKATNDEDEDRGWLTVYGGDLAVASGDDGVKAETLLTVHNGTVTVSDSVEGMEAAHITINGGTIDITASDDGVNAAGGTSTNTGDEAAAAGGGAPPAMGEMPAGEMPGGGIPGGPMGGAGGPGGEMAVGDYSVTVTGGTLTINAEGDGLDSNGDAVFSGGTVVVHGPTNNGNGALDVNGTLSVNGGTVIAVGSAGMAQTPADSSTQSGVQFTFDSTVRAGTLVRIARADGTVVQSFTTQKDIASLIYSSDQISDGETCTVYTGGTEGNLKSAQEAGTAVGGEYLPGFGPGF